MKANLKRIIPGIVTLALVMIACSSDDDAPPPPCDNDPSTVIPPCTSDILDTLYSTETFTFTSNGISMQGKIAIPPDYETDSDIPAIYLIDHCEEIDCVDEFDDLIKGVQSVNEFKALVITLRDLIDYQDVSPNTDPDHRDLFYDLVNYVDANYSTNNSRTFVGRGKVGRFVLRTLFDYESPVFQNFIVSDISATTYFRDLLEQKDFTEDIGNKKLHYSFTSTRSKELNMEVIDAINAKGFTWLEFEYREYPELVYPNAPPIVFEDGLKFLFED